MRLVSIKEKTRRSWGRLSRKLGTSSSREGISRSTWELKVNDGFCVPVLRGEVERGQVREKGRWGKELKINAGLGL